MSGGAGRAETQLGTSKFGSARVRPRCCVELCRRLRSDIGQPLATSGSRRSSLCRPFAHHLALGVFSSFFQPPDRLDPLDVAAQRCFVGEDVAAWHEHFASRVELFQSEMTHRRRDGGSWARLDRCYSSMDGGFWMLMDLAASVAMIGDAAGHLSNHCSLLLCWSCLRARLGFRCCLPEWVLKSGPLRTKLEKSLASAWDDEEDELIQLEVLKFHMRRVAKSVIFEEAYGWVRDVGCQLYVAMGALRCVIAGEEQSLCRVPERSLAVWAAVARPGSQDKALAVAPSLEHLFSGTWMSSLPKSSSVMTGGRGGKEHGKETGAPLLRSAASWR